MRSFESNTSRKDKNGIEIHIVVKAKASSELEILTGQAVYDYWWNRAHGKERVCS